MLSETKNVPSADILFTSKGSTIDEDVNWHFRNLNLHFFISIVYTKRTYTYYEIL